MTDGERKRVEVIDRIVAGEDPIAVFTAVWGPIPAADVDLEAVRSQAQAFREALEAVTGGTWAALPAAVKNERRKTWEADYRRWLQKNEKEKSPSS